jgi:rod shape-determining protein MreC
MRREGGNRSRLLLVILIATSLFLITLDLRGVKVVSGLKSGTQTVLTPFQKAGSFIVSPIRNVVSDLSKLGRTRAEIKALQSQNADLRGQLVARKNADGELSQLRSALNFSGLARFKVVSARVILQGSANSFSQAITIDAGSSSGIRRNMTVVNGDGLVGVVKSTTSNSAIVQLVSDPAFKMGIRVAGSQEIGILTGQGTDVGVLQLLDAQSSIKVGDVLLARGSSNDSPFVPGVPVGRVTYVPLGGSALAAIAEAKFFARLGAIGVVSVVVGTSGQDPHDALAPKVVAPKPTPTVTVFATPTPTPTK